MKTSILTFALALALNQAAIAKNTTTSTEQVTAPVTLNEDVDYVITGSTPFTTTGSINITDTDHAVVILENIRPSKALSYLSFIQINGETAINDENCQVKMYAQGSIIMPYAKDIKPLTVYSEQNFGGESVNDFGLENSGGYMNTLSDAKLNNRIRSFKLKRGYMVTFANNAAGRGYSRCFVADKEDLEIATLPTAMDQRISSYRIFKWNDAEKKGLANSTDYNATQALNVSWCYSFGLGEDRGIDCECVPHHIYEDWPSVASCGQITYSPNMKTNNEPGNSADDHPQDVATVLANWENLMATGMRLCSPSSHDGSLNWMYAFMDSIDARGWRCDILDMHCYWPEWNLNTQLEGWYTNYKRPIWVSEFVWGASWNDNGIFATDRTYSIENQQKNYDVMSKVLDNWNSYPYIERYAYWNSEADCSKIYKDGELSILGKYYASMKSGIGYNKDYEYIPKVIQKAPNSFTVSYTEKTRKLDISWNNPNMEFTDSTLLEVRIDNGEWKTLQKYPCSEKTSYVYNEVFPEDYQRGTYTYRVHNYDIDGKERMTNEVQISLVAAEGQPGFQYGSLEINDTEEFNTAFDANGDQTPAILIGLPSYNDREIVPVNTVTLVSSDHFTLYPFPWNYGSYKSTFTGSETTDFMVLSQGTHQIGDITMEVGESPSKIKNDSTWISFATPFPENVKPVVVASVLSRYKVYPYMIKIWGITHEGFAVKLVRQAAADESISTFAGQNIYYAAATPGTAKMEDGKILTVGSNTEDKVDGRRARAVKLVDAEGYAIHVFNPTLLCGPQTDNYEAASVYRISSFDTDNSITNNGVPATTGLRIIRQKDDTNSTKIIDNAPNNGDEMGWIIVSDEEDNSQSILSAEQQAPLKVTVQDHHIWVDGTDDYSIYAINGQQLSQDARLQSGVYIVKAGNRSAKVLVP
ncbi:MAG: glycoside hydrolase family protein [Paraprevotella sp.]|nr:glycoside hydrolase family protein [Paraprevotella sp.]